MPLKTFISYSRQDKALVDVLVRALEAYGIAVWLDRYMRPAIDFEKEIAHRIQNATAMLLLLSRNSVKSEYVRREYDYARKVNTRVIFVKIQKEVQDIPEDWAVYNFLEWRQGDDVSDIVSVLGDEEMLQQIRWAIWPSVQSIIGLELPKALRLVSQIQPLYADGKTLVVDIPDELVISENEDKIRQIIERELARYGWSYNVELHFPGRI